MGHKDNTGERLIYPMSRVDPADTRTELFCGLSKMVFLYFRDRYGETELEKFVYNTRMNLDYAMDDPERAARVLPGFQLVSDSEKMLRP